MAWQQMSLQTMSGAPAVWGSGPAITVSGDIFTYRDTITNAAKIVLQFVVGPVSGASSFGYSIVGGAWVISDANYKAVTIKNNSPSQWSSNIYSSLEWEIGNYDPSTVITVAQQFSSNSGRAALNLASYITIPRLELDTSGKIYIGVNNTWKAATPYIAVDSTWKKAKGYIGTASEWEVAKKA